MSKNENLKSKFRYINLVFVAIWVVLIFLVSKFNLSYKFMIIGFVFLTLIEGLICAYLRKNNK